VLIVGRLSQSSWLFGCSPTPEVCPSGSFNKFKVLRARKARVTGCQPSVDCPNRLGCLAALRHLKSAQAVHLISSKSYGLDKPVLRGADRRSIVPIVLAADRRSIVPIVLAADRRSIVPIVLAADRRSIVPIVLAANPPRKMGLLPVGFWPPLANRQRVSSENEKSR
jgi:hypothetical protein